MVSFLTHVSLPLYAQACHDLRREKRDRVKGSVGGSNIDSSTYAAFEVGNHFRIRTSLRYGRVVVVVAE